MAKSALHARTLWCRFPVRIGFPEIHNAIKCYALVKNCTRYPRSNVLQPEHGSENKRSIDRVGRARSPILVSPAPGCFSNGPEPRKPAVADFADEGDKLAQARGLHLVVLGPQLPDLGLVPVLTRGGQHHDGQAFEAPFRPDKAEDVEARELGQLQVEKNERGRLRRPAPEGRYRLLPVDRDLEGRGHLRPFEGVTYEERK